MDLSTNQLYFRNIILGYFAYLRDNLFTVAITVFSVGVIYSIAIWNISVTSIQLLLLQIFILELVFVISVYRLIIVHINSKREKIEKLMKKSVLLLLFPVMFQLAYSVLILILQRYSPQMFFVFLLTVVIRAISTLSIYSIARLDSIFSRFILTQIREHYSIFIKTILIQLVALFALIIITGGIVRVVSTPEISVQLLPAITISSFILISPINYLIYEKLKS